MKRVNRNVTMAVWTKPNKRQMLFEIASACRFVWNWAVEENMEKFYQWEKGKLKDPPETTFFALGKEFTKLRHAKETNWLEGYPANPVKFTLKRFGDAFQAFFRDCKQGRKRNASPPKFHSRNHRLHVTFPQGCFEVKDQWIRLQGVGWIKMVKPWRFDHYKNYVVKQIHMFSDNKRVWKAVISIECDVEENEGNGGVVGIDVNVGQYATPSDVFHAPSRTRLEKKRKHYQRQAARRVKGSNRWKLSIRRAAKASRQLAGRQRNWQHHESKEWAATGLKIAVEDLKLVNMTKSAKGTIEKPGKNVAAKAGLNREVLAMAWGQFHGMLEYKTAGVIKVNPKYTSQKCSKCGHISKENRNDREFKCVKCGHEDHADMNAAKNITAAGKRHKDAELNTVKRQ